ncbi:hypothetical protein MMYC01_208670 [Madurella mycetomatis]|uniref:Uncharacterized protein n=1 Tax=Madurella mycetomatis TaxID=100816 RepID=A0A175VUV0_9PEZI|nr:hypothetical protein MMYC01_208670 [Madurella mycetomatis]
MPDDEPSKNPFVRFKQHVDANIHAGLNSVVALSSTISRGNSNPSSEPTDAATSSKTTEMTDPSTSSSAPAPHGTSPPYQQPTSSSPYAPALRRLQPSPQLEAALDALRGGSRAEAQTAWDLFLTQSAYSPLRLHRELGWHPRAHGDQGHEATAAAAAATTGWLDAFEDLMLASSAAEMADLRRRAAEQRSPGWHHHLFALGDYRDAFSVHGAYASWPEMRWLRRMATSGLREVYFPVWDASRPAERSPRTMDEWAERRRREAVAQEEQEMAAFERARKGRRNEVGENVVDEVGSFFSDIGGVVRTLGKLLEDEIMGEREGERKRRGRSAAEEKDKEGPETEGDLYSVIRSAFNESERSLSNFFKSISEGRRDDGFWEPKPASPPRTETTEVVEDGITKKTTKTEFLDERGNTRSKTETTWTDEDGRIIMRQVQSSSSQSQQWHATFGGSGNDNEGERNDRDDREPPSSSKEQKKDGGWFWK